MTRKKLDFVHIRMRLYEFLDVKTDKDLANKLNVNPENVSRWRKRNTIPYDVLTEFCHKHDINYFWLIYGEGDMLNDKAEIKRLKKENTFMEGKVSNLKVEDKKMVIGMIERLQPE